MVCARARAVRRNKYIRRLYFRGKNSRKKQRYRAENGQTARVQEGCWASTPSASSFYCGDKTKAFVPLDYHSKNIETSISKQKKNAGYAGHPFSHSLSGRPPLLRVESADGTPVKLPLHLQVVVPEALHTVLQHLAKGGEDGEDGEQ